MFSLNQRSENSCFCQNDCFLVGSYAHLCVKIIPLDHFYANRDGIILNPTPRIALFVRSSVRDKISAASQIYASWIHVSGSRIKDHIYMYHTYMHHAYRIKYQGSWTHASYLHASHTHASGSRIKDQTS